MPTRGDEDTGSQKRRNGANEENGKDCALTDVTPVAAPALRAGWRAGSAPATRRPWKMPDARCCLFSVFSVGFVASFLRSGISETSGCSPSAQTKPTPDCPDPSCSGNIRGSYVLERRALGSVVEHRLHTAGVNGSNPLAPTSIFLKKTGGSYRPTGPQRARRMTLPKHAHGSPTDRLQLARIDDRVGWSRRRGRRRRV